MSPKRERIERAKRIYAEARRARAIRISLLALDMLAEARAES